MEWNYYLWEGVEDAGATKQIEHKRYGYELEIDQAKKGSAHCTAAGLVVYVKELICVSSISDSCNVFGGICLSVD